MRPPPAKPREPEPFRFNHILHLLLAVFTMGLWVIVWLFAWAVQHDRHKLQVSSYHQAYDEWVAEYTRWSDDYYDFYGVPAPVVVA